MGIILILCLEKSTRFNSYIKDSDFMFAIIKENISIQRRINRKTMQGYVGYKALQLCHLLTVIGSPDLLGLKLLI